MQIISIPTAKSLIKQVGVAKRRVIMLHGASGIGKSEMVAQVAAELEGMLVDIRVSQYESIDFRGIPDIQHGSTVWNMPATLPFKGNVKFDLCDPSKPIILFLDEMNQGDPSVLSVCYQLCNDRRIGEHELLDNVIIIAAGNRAQDRGTTNKFPAPLANRMTHAELVADIKNWSVWAAKANKSPTVIGFLNFRPELLMTFDPQKPTTVFASARTWSYAADDFADGDLPDDVKIASMAGTVGEGPAVELMGFASIMGSLVPIEKIIAKPTEVAVPTELDVQWAMATHVSTHMDETNASQLHEYLRRMDAEMTVMAWVLATNRNEDLCDTDAFLHGYAPQYRGMFAS
jgi:hypothetical protein